MKQFVSRLLVSALVCVTAIPCALALPASHYATSSKLATGKWVKIQIPQSGVYELTYDELGKMGFANPQNVRIYGSGGNMLSEMLDGTAPDDLTAVPVARYGKKICFYANGPVSFSLIDPLSTRPHFGRIVNAYSNYGYYFLTESSEKELTVQAGESVKPATYTQRRSSLNFFRHESELASLGGSGKDFLGEDISSNPFSFGFTLPNRTPGSDICVNTRVGASVSASTNLVTTINGDTVPFTSASSKIYQPSSQHNYYNAASPIALFSADSTSTSGTVNVSLKSGSTVKSARLDYVILTYTQDNTLKGHPYAQTFMAVNDLTARDLLAFYDNDPSNLMVWNIDDTKAPVAYQPTAEQLNDSVWTTDSTCDVTPRTMCVIAPAYAKATAQFVAFNPNDTLMKISGYTPVDNQNLHAMPTPEMLIIAPKAYMEQAGRIAKLHSDIDGMKVAVVDQAQIFNEFSSGTPDAMAYRLFCKMLYDRNSDTFKHLLLFGAGSYDNRGIASNHENMLLTYQSDRSDDEDYSYTTDDFFGILDDNSGSKIPAEMLRLGVGRFTSRNVAEAKSDVDKLANYMTNPDYGVWRNNIMLSADEGDDGLHMFQAEGTRMLLDNTLATGMPINRVFVAQYPKAIEPSISLASRRTAAEARRHMSDLFKQGQYFATYIGHAGPTMFTKYSHLWTSNEVNTTSYTHLPIMTTACCDVARFDSDSRGIADLMFHKSDGGAIALLTSSRQVYAESNDALNTAFINSMFSFGTLGYMPTLGYAYMKAKQSFGTRTNINKLSFLLLGDPAMRVNYPKPYFKLDAINGISGKDVAVYPLQQVTIKAHVNKSDNSGIDTDFNGEATLTIHDLTRYFSQFKQQVQLETITRNSFYTPEVLTQVSGKVVNGVFTATATIPRFTKASNQNVTMTIYAHKTGSDEMVNGTSGRLIIMPFDSTTVQTDSQAPQINKFYINDENTFSSGTAISGASTLYINATDDNAINVQSNSVGQNMTLTLDNGKVTYPEVRNYATVTNDGKSLDIAFPMGELDEGSHTLTYTVFDATSNSTAQTINFIVAASATAPVLSVNELPATDHLTFNATNLPTSSTDVTIKVTDAAGQLIWTEKTSQFPYVWNLTDSQGKKLPAGRYNFFGTVESGNAATGTAIGNFTVIEPIKTNK